MAVFFGSDGFRGVIGDTFNCDAVARITLAVADWYRGLHPSDASDVVVPIGYDTRFLARPFAEYAARLLRREGFKPLLASRPCPSPYLAFATRHFGSAVGLQLTASHNPPQYLGIKLKGEHGGSMFPGDVEVLQNYANLVDPSRFEGVSLVVDGEKQDEFSLDSDYTKAVIEAAGAQASPERYLIVDFMHGTAAGVYRDALEKLYNVNTALRFEPDPFFGGVKPEPRENTVSELITRVSYDGHNSVGLAFDGDGDRLAVIDERGGYLAAHEIFCVLLEHVVTQLDQKGTVVKTVSFSGLVDRVAEKLECPVIEVPVGFKSVSEAMLQYQAVIGGEESGGTGFGHYLPERDALLMALILLEARKSADTPLHEMVESLYQRYGRPVFIHCDVPLPPDVERSEMVQQVRDLANMAEVNGDEVRSLNHRDGMKVRTDHGWVLARMSGTEHILRVYAEAETAEQAKAYAGAALKFMGLDNSHV